MFGGATQYVETLDATLAFVDSYHPTTDELVAWHQETFANVSSRSSIMRRMGYLTNLGFLQRDGEVWTLGAVGQEYTQNHDTATLFRVMSDRNVGLRSLLYALAVAPMTIMEISDQQLDTHPELGWRRGETDMALQRANWLRSMGLVEKQGDAYDLTREGRAFVEDVESPNDVGLFFVAVNDEWLTRFKTSVVRPFKLAGRANVPSQLEGADSVRVWGTTATDSAKKQAAIDRLKQDDVVLFYHAGAFIGAGTVGRVFESQTVGDWLWNNPESRHIYTLNDYREDVPTVEEVRSMLGYKNDRFVNSSLDPVAEEKVGELVRQYGSLEAALFGSPVQEIPEPTEDEIQVEQSRLETALDSEATIVEDKTRYTIQKRKARDAAFRRLVTEAYDYTCAVCGSRRESPEGGFEVEAAHIYPKSKGGSEDVRNGMALCRLHHWAFDSGWLSVSDDYEVLVRDESGCEGYHEFKQYEGGTVKLPTDTRAEPSVEALQKHREIHEFV
ncbi:HNH endonuclease [Haladaptatus sp. QDMS2]|uniref:HNH endonuclease n=1 Tax=Haladaptatus sp. QDMS2 TaxID=3033391 RepID=UPI0023E8B2ED|nr:HNH endonuclease [Haladaptatus sp. QDMS2]